MGFSVISYFRDFAMDSSIWELPKIAAFCRFIEEILALGKVWNSRPRLFLASQGRLAHIPDDLSSVPVRRPISSSGTRAIPGRPCARPGKLDRDAGILLTNHAVS